jgi:hypothetical protein
VKQALALGAVLLVSGCGGESATQTGSYFVSLDGSKTLVQPLRRSVGP